MLDYHRVGAGNSNSFWDDCSVFLFVSSKKYAPSHPNPMIDHNFHILSQFREPFRGIVYHLSRLFWSSGSLGSSSRFWERVISPMDRIESLIQPFINNGDFQYIPSFKLCFSQEMRSPLVNQDNYGISPFWLGSSRTFYDHFSIAMLNSPRSCGFHVDLPVWDVPRCHVAHPGSLRLALLMLTPTRQQSVWMHRDSLSK